LFEAVLGEVLVKAGIGAFSLGRKAGSRPIRDDEDLLNVVDKFGKREV
jgi:hypothetical protein